MIIVEKVSGRSLKKVIAKPGLSILANYNISLFLIYAFHFFFECCYYVRVYMQQKKIPYFGNQKYESLVVKHKCFFQKAH